MELCKQLLACKLAYHAIGKCVERAEACKTGSCIESMDAQKRKLAGNLMRNIREKGENIQKKLGTDGKDISRKIVKTLEKNPRLCLDIGERLFRKADGNITEDDIIWLIEFAEENGIAKRHNI